MRKLWLILVLSLACITVADELQYLRSGNPQGPILLLVHGTPGSASAFRNYLEHPELQRFYDILAVNRLGWREGEEKDHTDPSFAKQAEYLLQILEEVDPAAARPVIAIGHSLGGALVNEIALVSPERVKGVLVIAGPASPTLSQKRWYHRWADSGLLSWALGHGLRNSNEEMLVLDQQLALQTERWPEADFELTIMQGMNDWLVHYDNATYLMEVAAHLEPELIMMPDESHFFMFSQTDLVIPEIHYLVERIERKLAMN
jgi:pimeloyl-ACP methyl ester carboxylesterase